MTGILTGQYVRIQQPTASVGDRLVAQLIDWSVQLGYFLFFIWFYVKVRDLGPIVFFFVAMLPIMLYPLLCEVFNEGQSIGKMVRRMRVVMADGSTPTLGAYLLRWLFCLVDSFTMGCLGSYFIFFTRNHQRLGDLAAGTVVIRQERFDRSQLNLGDYQHLRPDYLPLYPMAAELSMEQAAIIRQTLDSDNAERIDLLAKKVEETLNVKRREAYTDLFLQTILHDYQYFMLKAV